MTFLAFLGQKITKMAKKPFFYFEKWKLFWHTLIIWEDQHFSCFTLFGLVKKVGKNEIFLAFMGQKITKIAKKPFFIFKSGNFFWHTLIIWEDQHFSCNTLFDLVKKSRQKREKAKKNGPCTKVNIFHFCPLFWPNKKCKNWKM